MGMKRLELHLIGYSLISVVVPIYTSACGFVRLKVQVVTLDNSWAYAGSHLATQFST